ncbi:MAG: DUF4845 domain-containing protein [Sterolibacterium sp.]|nr:DUF4845 domain-containing protein [Sterolibacterium sp.]
MRQSSCNKQKGLTMTGLLFVGVGLVLAAVLGMKVVPAITEYYTTLDLVKATATDNALSGAGLAQVRSAYQRRMVVANIDSVGPDDLDISKEGGSIVITFAYEKKIHLFRNASLLLEFTGSSAE